jgi:glycerol uptake facilitator-like aquaporin
MRLHTTLTDGVKDQADSSRRLVKSVLTEFVGTAFLMLIVALVGRQVVGLPSK